MDNVERDQDEMDIDDFNRQVEDEIKMHNLRSPEEATDWFAETPVVVDSRLAKLLKAVAYFMRRSGHEIAQCNENVIQELCDQIERVLICIPTNGMTTDVNHAYYKLLDAVAEVQFPVTSLVNHVIVVGLRQATKISKYFTDLYLEDTIKLSYYLKHAHDPQHGLTLKGFRFSDFLIAEFYRHDCPKALLEILRYGCSDLLKTKNFDTKRHNWKDIGCTVLSESKLLDTLCFFLNLKPYLDPMFEEEFEEKADCLKIIFRSIHTSTFKQLYATSEFDECLNFKRFVEGYASPLFQNTVTFPEVDERIGKVAPSLKHMCRFEIRKNLYKNWALPDGIQALELPVTLKDYLDLKTD